MSAPGQCSSNMLHATCYNKQHTTVHDVGLICSLCCGGNRSDHGLRQHRHHLLHTHTHTPPPLPRTHTRGPQHSCCSLGYLPEPAACRPPGWKLQRVLYVCVVVHVCLHVVLRACELSVGVCPRQKNGPEEAASARSL